MNNLPPSAHRNFCFLRLGAEKSDSHLFLALHGHHLSKFLRSMARRDVLSSDAYSGKVADKVVLGPAKTSTTVKVVTNVTAMQLHKVLSDHPAVVWAADEGQVVLDALVKPPPGESCTTIRTCVLSCANHVSLRRDTAGGSTYSAAPCLCILALTHPSQLMVMRNGMGGKVPTNLQPYSNLLQKGTNGQSVQDDSALRFDPVVVDANNIVAEEEEVFKEKVQSAGMDVMAGAETVPLVF